MRQYDCDDVREIFVNALALQDFTIDRTGQKTIELIGANFCADEPAIFGTPNQEYIESEIAWYEKQSTNINLISKKIKTHTSNNTAINIWPRPVCHL